MKNSKQTSRWNTVTPLSKFLAMVLFITLPFIGFVLGMKYQRVLDINQTAVSPLSTPSPTVTEAKQETKQSSLCNFKLNLPKGYYYQQPINSFYGYTHTKSDAVKICSVILGPNYKNGYEGFAGEQIQINAYPINTTNLSEISQQLSPNFKINNTISGFRFSRSGYGGSDEILIFEKDQQYYQLIWRNQPNNLETVIKSIVVQI